MGFEQVGGSAVDLLARLDFPDLPDLPDLPDMLDLPTELGGPGGSEASGESDGAGAPVSLESVPSTG